METRLRLFDDVFLEILLGLALALLIAIGFAPSLVNLSEGCATQPPKALQKKNAVTCQCQAGSPMQSSQQGRETAIRSNVTCECQHDAPKQERTSLQQDGCKLGVVNWLTNNQAADFATWLFLCLFCFKLVHESSVMRYHTQDLVTGQHIQDPSFLSNVFLFISKMTLLGALYVLIILIYVDGNVFRPQNVSNSLNNWLSAFFAALLVASFLVPNVVTYRQLQKAINIPLSLVNTRAWLKEAVALWLVLDVASLVAVFIFSKPFPGIAWWISCLLFAFSGFACFVLLLPSGSYTLPCLEPWLTEIHKSNLFIRLLLCIFLVVPPALIVFEVKLPGNLHQVGILFVFVVNLLDWWLNGPFFFGKPP